MQDSGSLFAETFQLTVLFSGRVQGVGFRATAMQVAREFEVAGTVRNLADGRVELIAQGRRAEVEGFVQALEDRMAGCIRKAERREQWVVPSFRGFVIR